MIDIKQLSIEAISVGFVLLIIHSIVLYFIKGPQMGLFATGVITHLIFEFTGLNNWYCKYGNACTYK